MKQFENNSSGTSMPAIDVFNGPVPLQTGARAPASPMGPMAELSGAVYSTEPGERAGAPRKEGTSMN